MKHLSDPNEHRAHRHCTKCLARSTKATRSWNLFIIYCTIIHSGESESATNKMTELIEIIFGGNWNWQWKIPFVQRPFMVLILPQGYVLHWGQSHPCGPSRDDSAVSILIFLSVNLKPRLIRLFSILMAQFDKATYHLLLYLDAAWDCVQSEEEERKMWIGWARHVLPVLAQPIQYVCLELRGVQ